MHSSDLSTPSSASSTRATRGRRRLSTRAWAGLALGAALAIGAPLAASAHVHVDPGTAAAGATTPLTFSFQHGCDDSPTTSLRITIPKGVGNVTPVVEGGWSIERTLGSDGVPTAVTYTADTPIETGLSASVSMNVLLDTSAAGTQIAFPVLQTCEKGSTSWSQVPKEGQDPESLDTPAPVLTVGQAVAEDNGHDHASTATSTDAEHTSDASTTDAVAEPISASVSQSDTAARWMGGAGLVAGVAALIVALTGRRRKQN